MQLLIVLLLIVIILILAPWMIGVVAVGAVAYGAWLLIALAVTAVVVLIGVAVILLSPSRRKKNMLKGRLSVAEQIDESNRIARERESQLSDQVCSPEGGSAPSSAKKSLRTKSCKHCNAEVVASEMFCRICGKQT